LKEHFLSIREPRRTHI